MNRSWLRKFNLGAGPFVLGLSVLTVLAGVASAGHGGGVDHAKGASAGDPSPMADSVGVVIGKEDKPAPAAVGKTPEMISPEVGKSLLGEYLRAQTGELKALDHRGKLEIKEIKSSQAARQKEWEKREKESRHKYFAEHTRGPDRRAYIKDFMDRHRAFLKALGDEAAVRARDHESRVAALREEQGNKLKAFKEALSRNERPSADLWPGSAR